MVPTYTGKVGTYTKVLKKRFLQQNNTLKTPESQEGEKPWYQSYKGDIHKYSGRANPLSVGGRFSDRFPTIRKDWYNRNR